jgi:hypothetical protein
MTDEIHATVKDVVEFEPVTITVSKGTIRRACLNPHTGERQHFVRCHTGAGFATIRITAKEITKIIETAETDKEKIARLERELHAERSRSFERDYRDVPGAVIPRRW